MGEAAVWNATYFDYDKYSVEKNEDKDIIKKYSIYLKNNETAFIPKGAIHRIENIYKTPIKITEVQLGSILKETDIIRYKDIYGRVN